MAVFVFQDTPAREFISTCLKSGVDVPREIAVLGVDNSVFNCESCQPQLSSIALPWFHIGHLGALQLQRLLSGGKAQRIVLKSPLRVVDRESTPPFEGGDPLVKRALERIRGSLEKPQSVDSVAQKLGTSRATLYRRFRASLGTSLSEHVNWLRIERAKELLAETDLKIATIARKCGFGSHQRFGVVFRELLDITPGRFRERSRAE